MATPARQGDATQPDRLRRTSAGRFLRWSLVAIPVLLVAVYLLRGILVAPLLSGALVRAIERSTGVGVRVGAIEGGWLGGVAIREVRTVRPGVTGPLVSLEVDRLQASYSLRSLFRGGGAFLETARIEVDGARVGVNLAPPPGEGPAGGSPPGALPSLRIRGLDITAKRPGLVVRVVGISAETAASPPPGGLELTLDAVSLQLETGGVTVGPVPVAATVRSAGSGLQAELSAPGRGVRGTVSYAGGAIDASLVLEDVALGAEGATVSVPAGTVRGTLGGEARVLAGGGRELAATFSATLVDGRVGDVPLERLAVEGGFEAGTLRVAALEAVSGPNRVAVSDAVVPPEALRGGDAAGALRAASGAFSARLADLPAVFALAGRPLSLPGQPPSHLLEVEGTLGDGVVTLAAGRLALPRGGVRVERLRAELPPAGAPWSSTGIATAFDVDLPDAALLNRLLPLPALAGSIQARVVLDGTLGALQGSLQASARRLVVAGRAIGDLDLAAEAAAGRVLVSTAKLANAGGANRVSVDGLTLAATDLVDRRWRALLAGAAGGFGADLRDLPALLALAGRPLRPAASPVPPHRLRLAGRVAGGRVSLATGELTVAGGGVSISRAVAQLPSPGRPWGEIELEVAAAADLPDLGPLAALFGRQPIAGRLRATAEVRGTAAAPAGTLHAQGEDLAVAGLRGMTLALDAEAGRGRIHVGTVELRRGADFCTASGGYSPAAGRFEAVGLRFRVAQASAYGGLLPAAWPAVFGRIEGELAASGTVREPEGTFAAAFDDVYLGAAGAFRGRVSGGLSGGGADIERLTVEAPQGRLALAARLERDGGGGVRLLLGDLSLGRGAAQAHLAHPAVLRYSPTGGLTAEEVRLEGPQGTLAVHGSLPGNGAADISFAAAGLGTDGWLHLLVGDRVTVRGLDLRGRFTGSRDRPTVRLEGAVAALGGAGVPAPLAGRFDVAYAPGVLTVTLFEWTDGDGLRAQASGRLPLDPLAARLLPPGALDLAVSLRVGDLRSLALLLPSSVSLRGALEADVTLGGSWEEPSLELTARATGLSASGVAGLEGRGPFAVAIAAGVHRGTADLRSLEITAEDLAGKAAGTWTGIPPAGRLLRREGELRTGTLALRGSLAVADLALLRSLVGDPRRLEGSLAVDFTVTGPAADPAVDAAVRIEGGGVDYGGRLPALERIALEANVVGRTARIARASGEVAGAPFQLGGDVTWGEGGLRLDLTLGGDNLLLYRDERVMARADLDLRASGPLARLRLEGRALLQNSAYSRTVTLPELIAMAGGGRRKPPSAAGPLFALRDAPWRDLEFDVRLAAGTPVLIQTNLVRGAVRPDLALTGTGQLPVLSGNVFVDPTRVSLPGGALRFERGIVSFPPPGAGEPRVDLAGSARLLGYDVTVLVGGTLRAPEVTLSSIPPLPNEELLLLVLAGTPPGSADAQATQRILEASLARFVAESVIGTVAGGEPGESGLADRIEVEIGRNVTRSGSATIETRFRLLGGAVPTGGTLYVAGGTDVFDAYTMGVTLVFRFR